MVISKRVDLLNGNIFKSLMTLAIPIMATSLIQMAYNLTDMIWIGRLGSSPVAAVGAASIYVNLSSAISGITRTGGQVKLAQSIGKNDIKSATTYAQVAIQLGVVLTLIYSVIMIVLVSPLIDFYKLNGADVITMAENYLTIISFGLVFNIFNQIVTGLVTASGNSKTPFIVTCTGLVINIVLDPIFIFGLGFIPAMGVRGAAFATVLAQGIVAGLFVIYLCKDKLIFSHMKMLELPQMKIIKQIFSIGLPAGAQRTIFTAISMVLARLIADFGDSAIAVQKVGIQVEAISWMTADGFSVAVNSFIAQNYGAGNIKRTIQGYKTSMIAIALWGVISTLILVLGAGPIFKIFINEPDVLQQGIDYLVILGYSQFFMCLEIVTSGAFTGFSRSLPPTIVSVLFTAARIPLAMILSSTMLGVDGVWWSITISSMFKGVITPILFIIFLYKLTRQPINQLDKLDITDDIISDEIEVDEQSITE